MKKTFTENYIAALKAVMENWEESSPKGTKIKEIINFSMKMNPINCAWNFHWRKFNLKYLTAELIWYLLDWLNVDFIWEEAKIWKWIADEDWKVNSNYWFLTTRDQIWIESLSGDTQYDWALKSLKKDKDTRQAIIHYNQSKHQYSGVKDFVCTMYNQFFIRNNKLHMCSYMRSNDAFFWMSYDAVWFSLVQQSMFNDLKWTYPELELWDLYYNATSFHVYESFFEKSNDIINNEKESTNLNITLKDLSIYWIENRLIKEWFWNTREEVLENVKKEFFEIKVIKDKLEKEIKYKWLLKKVFGIIVE